MLILIGKTASGKDSVVKELVRKYGYKYIVPYTTRPPRENEVKGKDYHFISQLDFCKKIKKQFFVEWRSYHTALGTWYYGTSARSFYKAKIKSVAILTPEALTQVIDLLYNDTVVYLDASDKVILSRLILRGDNPYEAKRRIEADRRDFLSAYNLADYIVSVDHKSVEQIAGDIIRYMEVFG